MKNRIFSSHFSHFPLSYFFLTFLTYFAVNIASAQIPSSGLVGYWPFNGNANDESGNGNNGTVNGPTLTTDRFGNANSAYSFNGSSTISIPHNQSLGIQQGQYFSISLWAKKNPGITLAHIIGKRPNGAQNFNWQIADWEGLQFAGTAAPYVYGALSTQSVSTQSWDHIVGVYNSGTWSLYINSVLITINTTPYFTNDVNTPITIGNSGSYNGFPGLIDDVCIYNIALTSSEITQIYTSQTSTVQAPCPTLATNLQTGLVGYWPFCGNANDESGNGNNGTVNGATLTTDRFGNANSAYSFDGVNDFIQTNNISFANGGDFSISTWVNLAEAYANGFPQHYILANNAAGGGIYLNTDGNLSQFGCYDINTTITLNNWHHFVAIKSGINYNLYIDNVFVGVNSNCNTNFINGVPIYFGNSSVNSEFTHGKIDDISIYNRALTPAEISQLYTNPSTTPPVACTPFLGEDQTVCAGTSVTLSASSTSSSNVCPTLPANLQTGLVGYWPFCGNANDESGNGNNGMVNGATLTTDRFGNTNNAYAFDGVNDYVDFGDLNYISTGVSGEYTVSLWVNPASLGDYPADNLGSLLFGDEIYQNNGVVLSLHNSFGFNVYTVGSNNISICNCVPNLNEWINYTVTQNSNGISLYINGVYDMLLSNSINSETSTPTRIGYFYQLQTRAFHGAIDDLTVYNRALTASEIQQLYTLGQSMYSWSTGATTASINVSPTTTATYTCIVTDASGNACTDSVTVFVPQIESTDLTICAGETTTLSVSGIDSTATPSACPTLPTNLQNGLVGYWPFCGNANDASGNGNNGIVNGATLTTDRFGNANSAFSFDGVNDIIDCGNSASLDLTSNYSVSYWYQKNGAGMGAVLSKNNGSGGQNKYVLGVNQYGTNGDFCHWHNGPAPQWRYTGVPIDGQWNNIVWKFFGQTIELYRNGVFVQSFLLDPTFPQISANMIIGNTEGIIFWNGKIDDIMMFNRQLSNSEIQQLYTLGQTTYLWSNGATTPTINVSPTSTTTYTCTVTTNGFSCTDSVTVVVNNPVIDLGADVTVCGTSTTLTAPSGYDSYLWSNGATTNTTTVTANGTYSCTVTQGGCSANDSIYITLIDATITASDSIICAGEITTLSVNAIPSSTFNSVLFPNPVLFNGHFYSKYTGTANWFNAKTICETNGGYLAIPNSIAESDFIQGVSGIDEPGTWIGLSDQTAEGTWIDVQGNPVAFFNWYPGEPNNVGDEDFVCVYNQANGSRKWNDLQPSYLLPFVMETNSMPSTILWSNGATTPSINVSPTTTTTYTCTITTNGVSCTDSITVVVSQPVASITPNGIVEICEGESIALTANGGTSYLWNTGAPTQSITVDTEGVYTVTVTDVNGCTDTESQLVKVNFLPNIAVNNASICSGQSTALTASGGVNYVWSPATGLSSTTGTTVTASPSTSTVYTVTGTGANGCINTATAAVTVNALPIATITPATATTFCQGGSVVLNANTGTGLSYQWFNNAVAISGATSSSYTANASGSYTVLVTNALLCNTTSTAIEVMTIPNIDYFADADGDGFGDASTLVSTCVQPNGYVTNNNDCNDNNANQNTASAEICNGLDDDCDGVIDNGITFFNYYADADGDGFGAGDVISSCSDLGAGYATNNTDCNDGNGIAYPNATETCNNADDDCDGQIDEGVQTVYFIDNDGDTYGNPSVSILACTQPAGYTPDDTDCNDTDANINPGAEDIGGNGIDENCDGQIDNSIFELNATISLYPNPTRSELNIQVNSFIIGSDLYIFDAVGKLVHKQQLLSTQTTLPVSNFADGNYLVRVGEVVKRFVVEK